MTEKKDLERAIKELKKTLNQCEKNKSESNFKVGIFDRKEWLRKTIEEYENKLKNMK